MIRVLLLILIACISIASGQWIGNSFRFTAAAGGGPPAVTYQGFAVDGTNGTGYTFSAMPIGASAARDRVFVIIGARAFANDLLAPTSVTIGGVSATEVYAPAPQNYSTNSNIIALYSAVVPTGTTADVVVTFPASPEVKRCAAITYSSTDVVSLTPVTTALYNGNPGTGTGDVSITAPSGDSVVICGGNVLTSATTWAGVTEDADVLIETSYISGAHAQFSTSGTKTITIDPIGNDHTTAISVCFQ